MSGRAGILRGSSGMASPRIHRWIGSIGVAALAIGSACDRRPEANGGPRIESLHVDRAPYPAVPDLPTAAEPAETRAELFVWIDDDELLRLGRRGSPKTIDVSTDELLRAFWRLRGDPLGGRGAASPSSAPLVVAGKLTPAARVVDVVTALWQHGGRLAVVGGLPGSPREHPVRMLGQQPGTARAAGGAVLELGPRGLRLDVAGSETPSYEACGASPDAACLAAALDAAAETGVRSVVVRRAE